DILAVLAASARAHDEGARCRRANPSGRRERTGRRGKAFLFSSPPRAASGMDTPWRIELLGGLRACRQGEAITHFRTRTMADLLPYCASLRQPGHRRGVLMDVLGREADPGAGRHNLSVALSLLRQLLEPPGVPDGSVVEADRHGIGLKPAVVATDVAEF